jgi:hypothetical protein
MKLSKKLAYLLLTAALAAGCGSLRQPVFGGIYSDVTSSEAVSSNQAGNRVGQACSSSILALIASGDSSIEAARRAGGITLITSVDAQSSNILFFYSKYCTIVRGR